MTFTKLLKASAFALLTTATLQLGGISNAQAQNSYVLTCKPGGSLYQYIRFEGGRISSTVYFKGGSEGAATRAPAPGECTWIDRGFRSGEPEKLLIQGEGGNIKSSCNTRGCNTSTDAPVSSKLLKAINGNQPFQVHAYNNRNGHMVITKFGP